MATRDEIHRLLDGVPDDRVAAIGEILRAALEAGLTGDQAHRLAKQLRVDPDLTRLAAEPVRRFASAGTLSAEPDLAERSEEILRTEPPGTAARSWSTLDRSWPSSTTAMTITGSARTCWSGCLVRC
jgi:hypothetical protein